MSLAFATNLGFTTPCNVLKYCLEPPRGQPHFRPGHHGAPMCSRVNICCSVSEGRVNLAIHCRLGATHRAAHRLQYVMASVQLHRV
jgi:hypothetical protein